MIDLKVQREAFWLELAPGIRLKVRPRSSAIMLAARASLSGNGNPEEQFGQMIRTLAQASILEWEGITFGEEPAPVTPENILAVMEIWPLFRAFEEKYYGQAMLLDEEKKD